MLSKNLRRIRLEKGITQVEMCRKIGVTQQTFSSYETGRKMPRVVILVKIAEVLGVSVDELTKE